MSRVVSAKEPDWPVKSEVARIRYVVPAGIVENEFFGSRRWNLRRRCGSESCEVEVTEQRHGMKMEMIFEKAH